MMKIEAKLVFGASIFDGRYEFPFPVPSLGISQKIRIFYRDFLNLKVA
jgi:hypothetical protein